MLIIHAEEANAALGTVLSATVNLEQSVSPRSRYWESSQLTAARPTHVRKDAALNPSRMQYVSCDHTVTSCIE